VAGALRELTQAAYLDPYAERIHLLLARTQAKAGDADKAIAEFRMALWVRDDPAVRVELMGLLKQSGHLAEAKLEAERVLRVDPSNASAKAVLGKK
jgi:Flp pilus assembly protein TadD